MNAPTAPPRGLPTRRPDKKNGLPRARRLRARRDFARLERQGVRASTEGLVLIARPVRGGFGRIGFTLSRKVGIAVVRNKIRRRLRSYFRHNKELFASRDIIVLVKPEAAALDFAQLMQQVERAIGRLDAAIAKRTAPPSRRSS